MSNALGRDLAKLVAAVDAAASECGHGSYGQRFHIFSMRRLMSRVALRSGAMRRVAIL